MDERMLDALFRIFEDKMAEICSVVPSGHSKSIVSEDWFSYVDSLAPHVETIRPTEHKRVHGIVPRKTGNIPVLQLLADRINRGDFNMLLIEDPGISRHHLPTWGPNLILVERDFADKVVALGCLP